MQFAGSLIALAQMREPERQRHAGLEQMNWLSRKVALR